ncbi:MAG: hypothetical protein JOY54_13300 [Acidobacteriaceae bacterium]|nr:hypothetical protein [Acidobacteriaceae bacterium]
MRLGAALLALTSAMPAQAASAEPIRQFFSRSYNATAYISIFSVPIFSRSGVGSGSATAESENLGDERLLNLRFMAGSDPQRAHGLNRLGLIEESVRERGHSVLHADYFGLMTSSGEESLEQAKTALNADSEAMVSYVATRASLNGISSQYTLGYFRLSSQYKLSNIEQLIEQVQSEFSSPVGHTVHKKSDQHASTFLYSLTEAMQSGQSSLDQQFLYNGTIFTLHTEKRPDRKAAEEFRKAGLTDTAGEVQQLSGKIRNEKTGSETIFRLWFDASSANLLPLRFEFRPKAYLKLVFEAEPQAVMHTAPTFDFSRLEEPKP